MKAIFTVLLSAIILMPMRIYAQESPGVFYTLGENSCGTSERRAESETEPSEETSEEKPADDSIRTGGNPFKGLSVEELERMIAEYEVRERKQKDGKGLRFYEGDSHELTMDNLVQVVGETGLSNQLFVLAQAVLETGNFSSNVCKNYNNLFGLYDSRNKDYYRFQRWEDSVVGYKKFIQHRYKGGNYLTFLKRIGYAEDPGYIQKVAKIAKSLYHQLFDK
jgi:hypothetical protein